MPTCVKVDAMRGHTGQLDVTRTVSGQEIRKYRVYFNDKSANSLDAIKGDDGTNAVPPYGAVLSSGYAVSSKSAEQDSSDPRIWIVTVTFTLPVPGEESRPVADPDVVRWAIDITANPVPYEVEIQRDIDGKQILNSAGDPISGVTTSKYDTDWTFSFTAETIDFFGIDECLGAINAADVAMTINGQTRTFPALSLRFVDYSLAYTLDPDGNTYPKLVYKLRHRSGGWRRQIADKGFRQIILGHPHVILGEDGNPVPTAQYLNGTGGQQTDPDADVSTITVKVYDEVADMEGVLVWDLNT
jgi:hypothetical protein